MFCRYCGAHVLDDSLFCSKCGKRLGPRVNPRLQHLITVLRLKTPYPYFALLVAFFTAWAVGPRQARMDYSQIKWNMEMDRKLDLREDNQFQQSLSLVVENTGPTSIQDIPIELSAEIEPIKPAEVVAGFLGRKLVILRSGHPLPLVVVLGDKLEPGSKRRYFLEGNIQAQPPFKVTYTVREEDQSAVLTSYAVEEK